MQSVQWNLRHFTRQKEVTYSSRKSPCDEGHGLGLHPWTFCSLFLCVWKYTATLLHCCPSADLKELWKGSQQWPAEARDVPALLPGNGGLCHLWTMAEAVDFRAGVRCLMTSLHQEVWWLGFGLFMGGTCTPSLSYFLARYCATYVWTGLASSILSSSQDGLGIWLLWESRSKTSLGKSCR